MPSISIASGVLLILIGIFGYGYGMMKDGNASLTALFPVIFGLLLVIFGFLAKSKENLRKHLMHGAVIVGLLGLLGTLSSVLQLPALFAGTAERPAAVLARFAMAVVCLVFVILCVKSFVDARRSRTSDV
jgi:hypothetical protein